MILIFSVEYKIIGGKLMKNVDLNIDGNILTIKVDLTKDFGASSSGKSQIIATTEGNYALPGREEKIGLNIYKKVTKK